MSSALTCPRNGGAFPQVRVAATMKVLLALIFFPRGGSAQVMRYLAKNLGDNGWKPTILSGAAPGGGDAENFFEGLDVRAVDYRKALEADAPLRANPPMHPSFEDREGA